LGPSSNGDSASAFGAVRAAATSLFLDLHELADHPHYANGKWSIPIHGGQKVIPFYLKRAYQAVALLEERGIELTPGEDDEEDGGDEDESGSSGSP
jgi:hypothetical protein